jgi:hypothetical protein
MWITEWTNWLNPRCNKKPYRRQRVRFQPKLELFEQRLAPANVPILSGHYDNLLTGWNSQETSLTPSAINDANFGKLFNNTLDGYAYAQPLYVPQLNIPGRGIHDVVFVATEHDTLYAFDANAAGPALWQRSFIDPANGITTLAAPGDVNTGDIVPEVGITGTPIIDAATNTIYVIPKTKEARSDGNHFVQRLYAIDITTGANRVAPVPIGDTKIGGPDGGYTNVTTLVVPGTGAGTDGTNVRFNSLRENNRMSLQLVTNTDSSKTVYAGWASHGDNGPYHGWVVGFNASTLAIQKWFNTSPNGSAGAPWESGGNFAVDPQGNLYFANGNGFTVGPIQGFDANGGPRALGAQGGGLGYGNGSGLTPAGITNSVAVTFRAYDHSSTGLGTNANFMPDNSLTGSVIDFNAGAQAATRHVFEVTLAYNNSTHVLTETLRDVTANSTTVTETYNNLDIPSLVGSSTAWIGFTGGTGGLNMQQDIQTWTYTPATGAPIDHSAGFASNSDMLSNGSAAFTGTVARLTTAANNEAGSVFTTNQVNVAGFSTTFRFQMSAGTMPVADGLTFTIQNKAFGKEYAESVLKVPSQAAGQIMSVADFFTPNDWKNLDNGDTDLGSGGTMLLPDAVSGGKHLIIETGKSGRLYLIDRDHMGENVPTGNNDQILQTITIGGPGVWGNAAFFQDGANTGLIYYWGSSTNGKAYRITDGVINPMPASQATFNIGFPGSQPSISSNGQTGASAIMWAIRGDNYGSNGPETLLAFNAEDLSQQLWSSADLPSRDAIGGTSVKFTFPIESNGHVYAASNGSLAVYGLLGVATIAPAAPTNLTTAPMGGTQIQLNWTNPTPMQGAEPSGFKVERSTTSGTTGFTQVAVVPVGTATSYTDSGLSQLTHYWYRIRATNRAGDSDYSNVSDTSTLLGASTLTVTSVTSTEVDLSWTRVGNDHYTIERATDGGSFSTISGNINILLTTYADLTVTQNHTYQYRVHAFNINPTTDSLSNVAVAIVRPVDIEFPFPDGITSSDGLQFNGSAIYSSTEHLIRLNNDFSQQGSVFTTAKVSDTKFTTTFWIRLHEGTQPNPADGLTFTIQSNSPGALGGGGGALGYQGIGHSVAIKFDVFDNEGETNNSTGLFINGDFPGLPHSSTDVNVPLGDPNDPNTLVNLRDQHRKRIDISYDASTLQLTVTITDELHANGPTSVTQNYTVNIPAVIGQDAAYVGFTGGTGGLYSLQDISGWVFPPTPPAGPSSLVSALAGPTSINLSWTSNSTNESGFLIERSTDNYHFTQVGTTGIGVRTFQDTADNGLVPNTIYFYRVRAFNDTGNSGYSNVIQVTLGGTIVTIDHSAGFAINDDLRANGNTTFVSPSTIPAATLYSLDDGTKEETFNNSEGTETEDNWVANSFQVVAGSEILSSVSLSLGQTYNGRAITVAIYTGSDLMNPHAGTGLTRVSTTDTTITGTNNGNAFVTIPLNAPLTLPVGQVYWVAILLRGVPGNQFPFSTDTDSPRGRSWFDVGPTQGGSYNLDNTTNATVFGGTHPVVHSGVQSPGNLMLRVNAHALAAAPLGIFTAHQDIGVAGDPTPNIGNATFNNATQTYTLTASGSDIWDTSDKMHYLYQPMSGDGEIIARVSGENSQDYWTKGGIMIRKNLTTGSPNAFMFETADAHNEPVFQWRDNQDGGSGDFGGHPGTDIHHGPPVWLRLVRSGNTFSGYWAADVNNGQSHGDWQDLAGDGSTRFNTHVVPGIAVNDPVFVGLGLTAHNNGTTATATFDHVTVITAARLTDAVNNQDSSLFTVQKVPISGSFTTSWVMNMRPGSGAADGLTFTIQNDAAGTGAIGSGGGGLGYATDTVGGPQGIHPSVMIKFDMYSQGSHHATTGLYTNGESPNVQSHQIDMTSAGINFSQNHTYQVTLATDGITLTETVKDLVSGSTFTTSYIIDIAGTIGSPNAYVGFTGGTGGENAWIAVESWTASFNSLAPPPHIEVHYATTTSGAPVVFTVASRTANGAPVASYRGTIHFSSSDPQAILPADYTFTAADAGQHTFAGVLFHVGTDTITITDNSPTPFSDTLSVLVNPRSFTVTGIPSEVTAGDNQAFLVTALDYFGNAALDYAGTVHFSSTDPHATLPPDYTFNPLFDPGAHLFPGVLVTAGIQSITVVDPLTPSQSRGTESGILVDPAAASILVMTGFPTSTQAGVPHGFTVTAFDPYGNVATGYRGTVTFSSNDDQASLPADYTYTSGDAGSHAFTATLFNTGTRSITVTDNDNGLQATQDNITVTPGLAVGFQVQTLGDVLAGIPALVYVTAVDAYGNTGAIYTGTAHISSDDFGGFDYTFLASEHGSHIFTVTFQTPGSHFFRIQDNGNPSIFGEEDDIPVQ